MSKAAPGRELLLDRASFTRSVDGRDHSRWRDIHQSGYRHVTNRCSYQYLKSHHERRFAVVYQGSVISELVREGTISGISEPGARVTALALPKCPAGRKKADIEPV
jgi:hypothetical protein